MRPVQLIISAWGPYKDVVKVDFSKFREGSVFLITGSTGAGKTTIFDAISYALYGNVSGMNREKTTLRSDFADKETDTLVDFTFVHKEVSYHICRSPKYERLKKRGEGFTTSNETAVLEYEDHAPITAVFEVNKKIEEIMGINHEQFKQIAMIAQGEFLSLLYANSREKVEIFRNLFQTGLYDRMQRNLSEKSKQLYVQIQEQKHKMDEAIAAIDGGTNEVLNELVSAKQLHYEKIIEVLKEHIKETTKNAQAYMEQYKGVEEELQKKLAEITKADELNQMIELYETTRKKLGTIQTKEDQFKEIERKNKEAKKASQLFAYEARYEEVKEQLKQWEEKIRTTKTELEELQPKLQLVQEQFLKTKKMDEEVAKLQAEYKRMEDYLPLYDELSKTEFNLHQRKQEENRFEKELKRSSKSLEEEKENAKKLQEELVRYEGVELRLGELAVEIEKAKYSYDELRQALQLLDHIQKEELLLHSMQKEYVMLEQRMKKSKLEYEQNEELYKNAAVGLAARFLEENKPCPVCGSTSHPKKAVISHEVPDEMQLQRDKEIYEKNFEAFQDMYQKTASKQGMISLKKEEMEKILVKHKLNDAKQLIETFERVKTDSKELLEKRTKLQQTLERKQTLGKEISLSVEKQGQLEQMLEGCEESIQKVTKERLVLVGTMQTLRERLPKEYTKKEDLEKQMKLVQRDLDQTKEFIQQIKEKREQLIAYHDRRQALYQSYQEEAKGCEEKREKRVGELEEKIKTQGFSSIQQYQDAKCSIEEMEYQEKVLYEYEEQLRITKAEVKRLEELCGGKERVDLEEKQIQYEEIEAKKQSIREEREQLIARNTGNQRALESLGEKFYKVEYLSNEYGIVKELDNAAKGNNQERIVFEHFVLAAYFEDIIVAANQRLTVMTNSRYELRKVEKVSDARTKDSLDLEVFDQYTGKTRSVKTLSGGESFKAALSLALGLSDVIQQNAGGIEIDTLFIDEGFGSLDQESLDGALRTLTTLTGRNKLIGIISHVNELKERVENQVIVQKGSNGSFLEVVAL